MSLPDMLSSTHTLALYRHRPARTSSYGKAKKTKDREHPYKSDGVVYLPGDINRMWNCKHD